MGQPYDFVDDSSLDPKFDIQAFKEKNYPDNGVTNFDEAFASEADMRGFQQLVDQYLQEFNK